MVFVGGASAGPVRPTSVSLLSGDTGSPGEAAPSRRTRLSTGSLPAGLSGGPRRTWDVLVHAVGNLVDQRVDPGHLCCEGREGVSGATRRGAGPQGGGRGHKALLLTAEEVLADLSGDGAHHVMWGEVALRTRTERTRAGQDLLWVPSGLLNVPDVLTRSPLSPLGPMAP